MEGGTRRVWVVWSGRGEELSEGVKWSAVLGRDVPHEVVQGVRRSGGVPGCGRSGRSTGLPVLSLGRPEGLVIRRMRVREEKGRFRRGGTRIEDGCKGTGGCLKVATVPGPEGK